MASWDMGYQSDVLYTTGYYKEQAPVHLNFVLTLQGFECPEINEHTTACELGFGQGLSINLHAMSDSVRWYGNDFNPTQVRFAKNIANVAGMTDEQIALYDDAFGDFLQRDDLPMFDYITLHGIWSWISPENQQYIVDFIHTKLKVGGVVYISYNTAPGFTTFEPIRHLMMRFDQDINGQHIPAQEKFENIKKFCKDLFSNSPRYSSIVPSIKKTVESTLEHDYHYLSAEFFNQYWDVTHFDIVAEKLEAAKVSFACTAAFKELVDSLNLSVEQMQLLAPYQGSLLGEVTKDLLVNKQFRRDIFVKGPRKLSAIEHQEKLDELYVMMTKNVQDLRPTFDTPMGRASLSPKSHLPICQVLSDYKPHTVGEIKRALKGMVSDDKFTEALLTLASLYIIKPTRNPNEISEVERQRCLAYNSHVLQGKVDAEVYYLASPVLGGGHILFEVDQQILGHILNLSAKSGESLEQFAQSIDIPTFVSSLIEERVAKGQSINVNGTEVIKRDDMEPLLLKYVTSFIANKLPLFRKLGLV